ncbi:putative aryl-alcohol dehydrogenase [Aspergillus flavus AF70]|nr:putative aryl-alcohol dehydrogenase [Aspergillus flavus AF70]
MAITEQPYDYIIVGAGVGGLVLASRLSEDANTTVLLVEAGPNHMGDPRIETPGLLGAMMGNPDFDWDYLTEPQVYANNRQLGQPRGRMVGGSSALNFSLVMYPSRANFEAWESLGNDGWGPDAMAPYLRKFHTYTPPSETTSALLSVDKYMNAENQGDQGPLPISHLDIYTPWNRAWDDTFARLGWNNHADPIAGRKVGSFTPPLSVDGKTGQRGYAGAYYTQDVAERKNLHLLTETMVERVILKKADSRVTATGIQIRTKDGQQLEVSATREVIVSAGSLNSPQLLELSGIGAADLLQKHNIPVVLNLPAVGENLQDHCMSTVNFEVADPQTSADIARDPKVVQSLVELYEKTRTGPMTGIPVSVAYLPLVDHNGQVQREQIDDLLAQYLDSPQVKQISLGRQQQYKILRQMLRDDQTGSADYMFLVAQFNAKEGVNTMSYALSKDLPENYINILVLHNHPFSRGSIHIQSANAGDKPIYDPKYLSHPLDLEILARHTQFLDKIASTEPFSSLLKPGARVPKAAVDLADLDTAKEVVKDRLFHCCHPVGTCAMMPAELGGVVDNQLKVHGTHNLRVVDASIFPLELSGTIQATTYAVAERAADIIRATAHC